MIVFQILARVCLGVSANAVQKRLVNRGVPVGRLWLATHAWMLLPALLLTFSGPRNLPPGFWRDAALAGVLDALGNLAMVAALRSTDLSVFGPLNALRPVLGLGFGWLFLGEIPTPAGLGGVLLTVAGGAVLLGKVQSGAPSQEWRRKVRIVMLRVAGLSVSTFGAVFLKRAAAIGPMGSTVGIWVIAGGALIMTVAWVREKSPAVILPAVTSFPPWMAAHAALFLAMQCFTVLIFQRTLLAYSLVFFQLGMVLQVVVGRVFFREPAFGRRMVACLVMAAGGGLVLWRG